MSVADAGGGSNEEFHSSDEELTSPDDEHGSFDDARASSEEAHAGSDEELDDADIRALVRRLARPHPSGGDVIERAALLASGADFVAAMDWITQHDGVAEAVAEHAPRQGLHGARVGLSGGSAASVPLRFVLPAGALR
jgi:hypothetical protein